MQNKIKVFSNLFCSGIMLDTARSFISKENILKVLNVLAANKLNTFHWHITDSQSFPYESSAYPELSKAGAYSKNEVSIYT